MVQTLPPASGRLPALLPLDLSRLCSSITCMSATGANPSPCSCASLPIPHLPPHRAWCSPTATLEHCSFSPSLWPFGNRGLCQESASPSSSPGGSCSSLSPQVIYHLPRGACSHSVGFLQSSLRQEAVYWGGAGNGGGHGEVMWGREGTSGGPLR